MTTMLAMEERRRRALFELHGLLELQRERELLPYETRLLGKWSSLVQEMDERLRDVHGRMPGPAPGISGAPAAPILFGRTGLMFP